MHRATATRLGLGCLLIAWGPAGAADVGRVLNLDRAPHIRPGVWNVSSVLAGRVPLRVRSICFADTSIVSPQHPDCEPWKGMILQKDRYVLTDVCRDGDRIIKARREFVGDFTTSFEVKDEYSTSVYGATTDATSDQVSHVFVAAACPLTMPVRRTF